MHSDWFNGIQILQGRWQHGENVGYCYPSGLEKTLCKWDIYVPLVMKGLRNVLPKYGRFVLRLSVYCERKENNSRDSRKGLLVAPRSLVNESCFHHLLK